MGTGANQWSLRSTRATWSVDPKGLAAKDTQKDHQPQSSTPDYSRNGPRTIVFMLGGTTFSEIRSCYEVMSEVKRDIVIGKVLVSR